MHSSRYPPLAKINDDYPAMSEWKSHKVEPLCVKCVTVSHLCIKNFSSCSSLKCRIIFFFHSLPWKWTMSTVAHVFMRHLPSAKLKSEKNFKFLIILCLRINFTKREEWNYSLSTPPHHQHYYHHHHQHHRKLHKI